MKRDTKFLLFGLGCCTWGYCWAKFDPSWTAIAISWAVIGVGNFVAWLVSRSKWNERRMHAQVDKELADFRVAFTAGGDTCPVCCLYEYGLVHGLEKPGTRPRHVCLPEVAELRARFDKNFPGMFRSRRGFDA